jgi:hypothetical protein
MKCTDPSRPQSTKCHRSNREFRIIPIAGTGIRPAGCLPQQRRFRRTVAVVSAVQP